MKTKEKDFIEIDYVGIIKESGKVFDATKKEDVKDIPHNPKAEFKPLILCLGQNQVIKGLDENLINKEVGKEYEFEISSEKAFGPKNPKLIKIVSTNILKSQKIEPYPGLQLQLGNFLATVRSVSGGRTTLDLNHPLAGKTLLYKVKINRILKDEKEKLEAFLKLHLNLKDIEITVKNKEYTVERELPKEIADILTKKIKEIIPSIQTIKFKTTTKA